jgi:hypothetical protein
MLSFPLTNDNYNTELNTIKYIATKNGYNSSAIDRIVKKQKRKRANTTGSNDNYSKNKQFVSVEFSTTLQYPLKRELKPHGITLAYKTSNKLGTRLNRSESTNQPNGNLTGAYKLNCSDCPKYYVGQTGRSFKTRFSEHLPKPKLPLQKSKFAQHLLDLNHKVDSFEKNTEILHIHKKGFTLDTLEEYEIYKATKKDPSNMLNEKLNYGSNKLFNTMLKHLEGSKVSSTADSPSGVG